jgi:Fe-S-cluster containining protein
MTPYQREQKEALEMVRKHISSLTNADQRNLKQRISEYLAFRQDVDAFLNQYFSRLCTQTCYQDQLSACCSRDGIITFFADGVINALESSEAQLDILMERLTMLHQGNKCVYLGKDGCLWQIRPLVCAMFLCTKAEEEVLEKNMRAKEKWEALKQREKSFRWPDQAILFDDLEEAFIKAGYDSTLMYLHNSPGLLRVKKMSAKNG